MADTGGESAVAIRLQNSARPKQRKKTRRFTGSQLPDWVRSSTTTISPRAVSGWNSPKKR